MSSQLPLSPTRVVFIAAAAVFIMGGLGLLSALSHSRSAEAAAAPKSKVHTNNYGAPLTLQSDQSSIRRIDLYVKDLVVDPNTQKIYASIPSAAGSSGNSIASFDPVTSVVGPSVFIGSEPGKMVISGNGQFVYVALTGAGAVRRFDLATQTPGPQISLGNGSFSGPLFATDMAVQPENPTTLAILRSGFDGAVAIYDDAGQRSSVVNSFNLLALTFSPTNPSSLYGLGGAVLTRMTVGPSGVTLLNSSSVTGSGAMQFDDGRLYTSSGHVLNPDTGTLFGTFTGTDINASTPFVSDSVVDRVYFLTAPFSSPGSPTTLTLRVFNQQTFVPVGTLDIPNVFGAPSRLVRWGSNGLAFCTTSGQFFVIQTTLVPSTDPVPTPTPTPIGTPTPLPTPPIEQAFIRQMPLAASDIIYDPGTEKIYASLPSSAGSIGNSVTPINTADATTGSPVFVGSEPNKLARSDNGQYLYVSLDGAAAVRRVDIAAQTADIRFSLGSGAFGTGPTLVQDMEVVPGHPTAVAISRRNVGFSPAHEGVAVYDNGVRRPTTTPNHTGSNLIEFSATADTLYGINNETTEFGFRKMSVTNLGVTVTSVTPGVVQTFGNNLDFSGGRVYFSAGRVIEPESATLVGTFQNIGFGNLIEADSSVGRVFFIDGASLPDDAIGSTVGIRAFDPNTFLPLGSVMVSGVNGRVRSFIRWGTNGLAFCTSGGQVFLIQSSLVSTVGPAPTPTPTPIATPTPTPTPIPTPATGELRQISLATNDLVVDPNSQTIFASVPSSAGANGNSLAPIDAVAGTVGQTVFVGSEPSKLAISDNGESIYVALNGANAVRRFDVASRTPGIQFSLGSDPFSGPFRAEDMAVAPGQPGVLAVSRMNQNSSPRHTGVAVFDNGVQREKTTAGHTGSNVIEFSISPNVLYGQNIETTEFGFRRMAVASCGVVTVNTTQNLLSGFGGDFKADNGVAYSAGGRAVDPEASAIVGTFVLRRPNSFSSSPSVVAPDSRAGRVYFVVEESGVMFLRIFNTTTFLKVGELRLPGVTGTISSLARWGTHGLAFRNNSGQVYLLQNSLIGGIDPSFTPAPLPPPPTSTVAIRVSSFNGDPGGVTLDVTGSVTTSGTTDSLGNFALPNLPPCGSVTVTPSKTNYFFSPTSLTVDLTSANPNLDFTATLKTVGLQQNTFQLSESNAKLFAFVARNSASEPATVAYETVSGTASDRSDFSTTLGTLQFATGETSKLITILLTNDTLVEGTETFTLTLKDPTGAQLVPGFSTATVSIVDDDTQPGMANPLSDARFFVRQHYQDFLNRAAVDDPSGFDFWTNQITSCEGIADPVSKSECLTARRINVSAAFFISIEFQQTGYLVHRFYIASYPPGASRPRGLPRFTEFLRDTQEVGRDVVVGATGWEQKLEQNKQAFALAWVNRPEFLVAHPESQTAGQFVDSLFLNTGATPTPAERAAAITAFGNGLSQGRAQALRSVAESASVYSRHFNSAFVLAQYFGYLRRNADDAPDGNFDGYQFWLDKLNQFNGNFVQADMVKAFLVSQEYQQRFGQANFDISR
ncbi:MAG: hypothetical protein ND895_24750 [Pyrinomonadaceae bacterium]|nr:hypothetical protein [Pyrinomonadaceae bacterium]